MPPHATVEPPDLWPIPVHVPVVRPGLPILIRPANRVQVGCDPERSLVIDLAPTISADAVATLLQSLQQPRLRGDALRRVRRVGLTPGELGTILGRLAAADHLLPHRGRSPIPATPVPAAALPATRSPIPLRAGIVGRGPLTELLATSLGDAGIVAQRSVRRTPASQARDHGSCNLVLLTDFLVQDPTIVARLQRARIAHLPVTARDGVGIVGPLVLPGLSSCLRCADHHRTEREPDWPLLAAQMLRRTGYASGATLRATAALAHEQVEHLATTLRSPTTPPELPQLTDTTLELHPRPTRLRIRRWPAHPLCGCRL